MKFFSGFSLKNEEYLFEEYIDKSDYSVCGFSYGSIKALSYVKEQLSEGNRIDRLQLLSPAFFQTKALKFKRLQLMSFKKNEDIYLSQFIASCFSPHSKKIIEHTQTTKDELEELLYYEWNIQELQELVDKGVIIEVYLAQNDAIINADDAKEYFLNVATVTYIKNANHFLQTI